ncbi:MAG: sulfotransferase domain-containing protein [Cyanobacteria bacterium J06638_28]
MSREVKIAITTKRLLNFPLYIKKCFFNKNLPDSVYFMTFHKCASTLFANHLLKQVKGLEHIDYEALVWNGLKRKGEFAFHDRGFIYGPIRLNTSPYSNNHSLVTAVTKPEFIRDKKVISFVRDPRDIMVSAYYSFGFSHSYSPVKEIQNKQKKYRNRIQQETLDGYVLQAVDQQLDNFKLLESLLKVCKRSILLKYEDMVFDFEGFAEQLREHIEIDENTLQKLYTQSRPKQKEDFSSHRRSGQTGEFRSKLKDETIGLLNSKLRDVLEVFEYEP